MAAEDFKVVCECGRFQKNATCFVVARLVEVRGIRCGDIRAHAVGASGEEIPTRGGLTLRVPQLEGFKDLVDEAIRAADAVWGAGPSDAEPNEDPGDADAVRAEAKERDNG